MANRYWIKISGTGDYNDSANWSATSGGSGGASAPIAGDNVFFDRPNTYTVNFPDGIHNCDSFQNTAGTVTFSGTTSATIAIRGTVFTLASTATWQNVAISITGTAGVNTDLTSNSVTISANFQLGNSRVLTLQDNLTIGSASTFQIFSGTFNLNKKTITCGKFVSSTTSSRTINFGASAPYGSFTLTGTGTIWNTGTVTNLTISPSGSIQRPVTVTPTSAGTLTIDAGALGETQALAWSFVSIPSGSTISFVNNSAMRRLNFESASGSCTVSNAALTIYDLLQFGGISSSNFSFDSGANAWTFTGTTGGNGFNLDGNRTFNFPWVVSGSTYWEINNGNLTVGALTHSGSTLNIQSRTLTVTSYTTGAGTKTLQASTGKLVCSGSGTAFDNANPSGLTISGVPISLTSASPKTFNGGGISYTGTVSNDGAGALTIVGNNTFTTLANGVSPTTFTFTSGSTTTVTNWNINGTSGNLVTINSTSTSQHTLSKSSGTVDATNLNISYSNATGGATWNAGIGSIDGGNNTGWRFLSSGNFIAFFTQ